MRTTYGAHASFGITFRMTAGITGSGRWIDVAPAGATTAIGLVPAHDGVSAGVETGIRLATDNADAANADLRSLGVDADPEITRMDPAPPMFAFRDADGNRLEIIEVAGGR
jgi:catechol 2,3-dioxygenase-like lactoylglutathione lyase family enzyme